jgi:hypothetical protein
MNLTCQLLFLAFFIPAIVLADTNATVFPPVTVQNQECGSDQLRVLSWAKNVPSTICLTGQEVMSLAIPNCGQNQQVVYDAGKFACRSTTTIPTCTSNQYLSFNGSVYECKSTVIPTCGSTQVLTNTGSGLVCVERGASIPTCAANQFLTYNGTNYQCASTQKLALPVCGANAYVTSDGNALTCTSVGAPCGTLPSGASCTNTAYVTGASTICNFPDQGVNSMVWKSIDTFTCTNGQLISIGHYAGEGACSNSAPGVTTIVNECPN